MDNKNNCKTYCSKSLISVSIAIAAVLVGYEVGIDFYYCVQGFVLGTVLLLLAIAHQIG